MYTPGHPCHGPGFGPKNCWRSPKNCWRRINILLRDNTCCMFSIFPLCSHVSFELPLCSRVSFELWVCRHLVFVITIFKTRFGVQLNPGSATGRRGACFAARRMRGQVYIVSWWIRGYRRTGCPSAIHVKILPTQPSSHQELKLY